MFKRGANDDRILCENFFGRDTEYSVMEKISTLKFEDFFIKGNMKNLDTVN